MARPVPRRRRLGRLLASAAAAHARSDLSGAERQYREVVTMDPSNAMALHQLALVHLAMGRPGDAEACLERAVSADPGNTAFRNNLGNLLLERGELARAAAAYEAVLAMDPSHLNSRFNLAAAMTRLHRPRAAATHYRALLERVPGDPEARRALAASLLDAGEVAEAEQCLRELLSGSPADPEALNLLGVLLARRGETEEARRCYLAAIDSRPDHARAYENLVRCQRFESPDDALVDRLERLAAAGSTAPSDTRVSALFALGKIYDDCGDYERAFARFRAGNRLVRPTVAFDRDQHRAAVDAVIEILDPSFIAAGGGIETELPVYVLGMIRSGTTLVEQILASHPLVHGAGEQKIIPRTAQTLAARPGGGTGYPQGYTQGYTQGYPQGYPQGLATLDAGAVSGAARDCRDALARLGGDAVRVVDKLPGNFLYIGLIARMFPGATIVHCVRDPLDVCLSIYFQRFAEGHHYAYDLGDIAAYHRDYQRLMAHWQRVLPAPMHEIRYESLVTHQESVSRALVGACGLSWDPACLAYHRTDRFVATASDWQVRQPVYTRSTERWRHYAEHIGELREGLGL